MGSEPCRPFVLISHPRSASNLLLRILSLDDQPSVLPANEKGGYLCMAPTLSTYYMAVRGKPVEDWTENQRNQTVQGFQSSFDEFQNLTEKANAEGKILFLKEHGYFMANPHALAAYINGNAKSEKPAWPMKLPPNYDAEPTKRNLNNTVFPDQFLQIWRPTFLIRHPALMFPSYFRAVTALFSLNGKAGTEAAKLDLELALNLHWTRSLYDWYMERKTESGPSNGANASSWPVVLDADDVINDQAVVKKFAEMVGLDTTKLRFSWTTVEEKNEKAEDKMMNIMLSTLNNSEGVRKDKIAGEVDIDAHAVKWREEFGSEDGANMERWVKAAMPDYEYLKARKLRETDGSS